MRKREVIELRHRINWLRVGPVDVHAAVLFVVVVGVVGVHRQHGEDAGQLDALAQHVGATSTTTCGTT